MTLEKFEADVEDGQLRTFSVVKPAREAVRIIGVATALAPVNAQDVLCIGGGLTQGGPRSEFLSGAATSLYRQHGKLQGVVIGIIDVDGELDVFAFEKEIEV